MFSCLKMRLRRPLALLLVCLCTLFAPARPARAYSLLTHEQLIDLTWDQSIVPLLLSRYPHLTPAQIEHARAYAYGGCVIQDIGYYPFGDPFFSNLTHYVRSGDFVVNLFRNAQNANELAFAVGALSHYIGDNIGHAGATNQAVPIEFPRLRAKYGNTVNYAEGAHQHVQTEFAFDINEIAHHRFAPVKYLRHVGLEVPTRQLAAAFYQTYGLGEDFSSGRGRRINVKGYRFAVRSFLPRIAYAVTILHRHHEPADVQDKELQRLESEVQRIAAKNDWDTYRRKPGIGTYSLAYLLYVLPKFGPIKLAAVKGPTPQTEMDYIHSVVRSTDVLNRALRRFTPPPTAASPSAKIPADAPTVSPANLATADSPALTSSVLTSSVLTSPPQAPQLSGSQGRLSLIANEALLSANRLHPLANRDLDTGNVVRPAGYRLTDETYADLLHRLIEQKTIPPGIKTEVLSYFADPSLPYATKRKPQQWATVQQDLVKLQAMPAGIEDPAFATYEEADK